MGKCFWKSNCLLAALLTCFWATPADAMASAGGVLADTVYYNGTIYTVTETPQEAKKA